MTKKIVKRVEDGMDRREILCTTYQMRNFYRQFGDGVFSPLDVFNYIQHHQIAKFCKPNDRVLDVCCGRGLMLPLLRRHAKGIASYCGVDIAPRNATFMRKRVTDGKPLSVSTDAYYGFLVRFVEANVAEMSKKLRKNYFDVIIYTSALEHMHYDDGLASLHECRKVIKPNGLMILTCPRTPEDKDGYDTQYRAHVYEWKRSEIYGGLHAAGFTVVDEWGLTANIRDMQKAAAEWSPMVASILERLRNCIPREWLTAMLAPLFTDVAKEVAFLVKPQIEFNV